MKKRILLITISFLLSLDISFAQSTTISGKVTNFKKRKVTLKGFNYKKNIRFNTEKKTFSKTLDDIKTGHYTISFKRRTIPIYIKKGKKIHLEFDVNDSETIPEFSGANSDINTYLSKKIKAFSEIVGSANRLFRLDESTFLEDMNTYKETLENLLSSSNLSQKYTDFEKRNIFYAYARNINNYENYHQTLTRDNDFKVSGSFPNHIEKIDFNNGLDYKHSLDYRMLIKDFLYKSATEKSKNDADYALTYLDLVAQKIKNQNIKNDLVYEVTQKDIAGTADPHELFNKFIKNSTNKKNNKEITGLYNQLKKVAKGNPSPTFSNYKNFNGGKTSLKNLTGKNKYICIYLWATWCSYCKKEIKELNNLMHQINTNKVEFVGINVDNVKKFEKWKKMVVDKKMPGTQLFSGKEHMKLDFAKKYLVQGVPRFILLKPDGTIISANAPRPVKDEQKFTSLFQEYGLMK